MGISQKMPEGALGSMSLGLGWRGGFKTAHFVGGPYDLFPGEGLFGVCVRSEATAGRRMDLWLPIHDFDVPDDDRMVAATLLHTFEAAFQGKTVYVGCMGGIGRTGLFLALAAKAAGVADPVAYVRKHYLAHAVETKQQRSYIARFDASELRWQINRAGWAARFRLL